MTALKVAIDARFIRGSGGGVESVVVGLAQGFQALVQSDVKISFVTYAGHNSWFEDFRNARLGEIEVPLPGTLSRAVRRGRVWAVRRAAGSYSALPSHDRVMDSIDADIVHFPFQGRGWVRKPYLYHPHDLQHRHLPEFFTRREHAWRELMYGEHCRRAAAISVGTTWVKDDLVSKMNVDPEKIFVVPLAPIAAAPGTPQLVRRAGIPLRYLIYPAANWPHKNHRRLFEALALLRGRGMAVPLVVTGPRPAEVDLRDLATRAGVADLVHDLEFISQGELEGLISNATAMVVPTLFEAASFPIWESFRLGTPVGCSTVTSLPKQVGDAALTFDPTSVPEMASVVQTLWTEPEDTSLRIQRGHDRLAEFSWPTTARHFLALYRKLGGRRLSTTDRLLLEKVPAL